MLLKKILLTSTTMCTLFFYFATSFATQIVKEEIEDTQTPTNGVMDISKITPVTNDMQKEEAISAITSFFKKEVLKPEHEIKKDQIESVEDRVAGVRTFKVLTLKDETQWVLGNGGIQRFLGYLYLKKSMEYHKLEKFRPAEARFIYEPKLENQIEVKIRPINEGPLKGLRTINSSDFLSISRYMGDDKPEEKDIPLDERSTLVSEIGFHDITSNANLRIKDSFIYVFDTEYISFKNKETNGYHDEDASQENKQEIVVKLEGLYH